MSTILNRRAAEIYVKATKLAKQSELAKVTRILAGTPKGKKVDLKSGQAPKKRVVVQDF